MIAMNDRRRGGGAALRYHLPAGVIPMHDVGERWIIVIIAMPDNRTRSNNIEYLN